MINIDDVSYENSYPDGRRHWQDVVHNGEKIGAICHAEQGMLNPLNTWHQKLLPESEIQNLKSWYISEDVGFVFGVFHGIGDCDDGLKEMIDYINNMEINNEK